MPTRPTPSPRARALAARRPVFDAHVDSLQRQLDLGHDLGTRTSGHLDLVRGREGGLGSMVFVDWVDPKYIAPELGEVMLTLGAPLIANCTTGLVVTAPVSSVALAVMLYVPAATFCQL